jgi:gamma-glutamylputrescine oxidase
LSRESLFQGATEYRREPAFMVRTKLRHRAEGANASGTTKITRMRGEMQDQSGYEQTWYASATRLPALRAPLNYDLEVDVCVIGGGLAGITIAREVARRGWSVAVLETRRIAWAASGRNSGFVMPGFSAQIEKVVERIGLPATKALWELSLAGVQYVRDAMGEIGIAGITEGRGWLDVVKIPDVKGALTRVKLLEEELGTAVEIWPTERVRDVLKTNHYFQAVCIPDAFQINPLAYVLGLADAAERAGARIFENTPATVVDLAGVRKRIETPKGRVRAGHVVLSGGIYLGSVAQELADTLIPVTACTGVTQSLGARLAEAIAFRGAVSESCHDKDHYRIVGGDRLLWTGRASARTRNLKGARQKLERAICATYPQLGSVEFEYFWPTETGLAVHGMPQIGEVEPGVWLASAFGGQGINTSAIAGDLIARAVVEGDDTWRCFLPFELVWAGGWVGRTVVRATNWWCHQGEAVVSLAARRREAVQRKRQDEKAGLIKTRPRPVYREVAAVKRALKRRFVTGEHDRPIGAPEAAPAPKFETASKRPERTR